MRVCTNFECVGARIADGERGLRGHLLDQRGLANLASAGHHLDKAPGSARCRELGPVEPSKSSGGDAQHSE